LPKAFWNANDKGRANSLLSVTTVIRVYFGVAARCGVVRLDTTRGGSLGHFSPSASSRRKPQSRLDASTPAARIPRFARPRILIV
jgi:hypothetical protein